MILKIRIKIAARSFLILLALSIVPCYGQNNLPDNILASLKQAHPRLLVDGMQDFENLKLRIKEHDELKIYSEKLRHTADTILSAPPAKYVLISDQGGKLLAVSRIVLGRTYALAMVYRLTHERKYAERLWEELLSASHFPDWNPRHFLDDAEMMHAFAIGYDWLYDYWSPEQRKIIKQAIVDKGLLRGYLGYNQLESNSVNTWFKSVNNWNQVCNGGLTVAALAVADEEPLLSAFILKKAISTVPNVMKRFAPDGANEEGPGYWTYGTRYNVCMIECLRTALGTDFGLSDIPGFSKTGNYFITMGGPGGRTFSYSDNWLDTVQSPELFWFAKRFNQPLLASYQKQHPEYTALELLWYPAEKIVGNDLPLDNYYRNAEIVTLRSSWKDPNALFVGFKGGSNRAGHAHLDIGTYTMEKDGVQWLVDLNHDEYGLPGYFDSGPQGQRWSYYRLKAEGHNTLVLNPDKNPDQDPLAKSPIIRFVSKPNQSFGVIDMTAAYHMNADSVKRGIAILNKNKLLVEDEITAGLNLHELYWFVHTPATIKLSKDGRSANLILGKKMLKARILSPLSGQFEILDARPLPESAQPLNQTLNTGIRRLTIHIKNPGSVRIAVVFEDSNEPTQTPVFPLSEWR